MDLLTGVATCPGVGFGPAIRSAGATSPGVLLVDDLTPAGVQSLDPGTVRAVASAAGAPLSHAAILVRSLGIPAVTGLGHRLGGIPDGAVVLVDGDAGTVRVDPNGEELAAAGRRRRAADRERDAARRRAADPAVTRDGTTVPVLANVGTAEDARRAVAEGADGVGMFRTEFAFLGRDEPPDEDEQYRSYARVADAVGERPLVVRTLDLGADVPGWNTAPEPNPALGHRGIRLALADRALLRSQLRAVVRLAEQRPVAVMFPMLTTVDELRAARSCLEDVAGGTRPGRLRVGITVEVPAAALTADVLAPLVDFLAIGTNDLTQYTLAADRSNAAVAGLADGLHPAVLSLVRRVTMAAADHGRTVCVVGELATDPVAVPILVGLGVTELSVRPNAVAAVKQVLRRVDAGEARAHGEVALQAESAAALRRLAASW